MKKILGTGISSKISSLIRNQQLHSDRLKS